MLYTSVSVVFESRLYPGRSLIITQKSEIHEALTFIQNYDGKICKGSHIFLTPRFVKNSRVTHANYVRVDIQPK